MATKFIDKKTGLVIGSSVITSLLFTAQSVRAEDAGDPISEVSNTVDSIGVIAGTAASIVIVAMGVRLAIKQVNRVMTKA